MKRFIAYFRVSTQRQGQSGLGLEAQQAAVKAFAGDNVIESFVEVETATNKRQRPELQMAIAACKRLGATLIVAKLDRLSRNVAFVSALLESGIEFMACDNPHATRLLIHVMSAFAEEEARQISQRTRAALEAAKQRGVKLGTPANLTPDAREKGIRANVEAAERHAAGVRHLASALRAKGRSLREVAHELTQAGHLTRTGKPWSAMAVSRILKAA